MNFYGNEITDNLINKALDIALGNNNKPESNCGQLSEVSFNTYCYSMKDSVPAKGYEELPQFSYDSITWHSNNEEPSATSGNEEEPNEYECLVLYHLHTAKYSGILAEYEMETDIDEQVIRNTATKFRSIQVAGYSYYSLLHGQGKGYCCAYRVNDEGEKVLWPGQVQFFFRHTLQLETMEGAFQDFDHYFAFVRWFNPANENQILSEFENDDDTSCWQNSFEEMTEDCVLPVHMLHSGISIRLDYLKDINIVVFFPRKFN